MADRFWEHNTQRRHVYIDDATGRIVGTLVQSIRSKTLDARAYDRRVGEFSNVDLARAAVEQACVEIEAEVERAAAAKAAQADGGAA